MLKALVFQLLESTVLSKPLVSNVNLHPYTKVEVGIPPDLPPLPPPEQSESDDEGEQGTEDHAGTSAETEQALEARQLTVLRTMWAVMVRLIFLGSLVSTIFLIGGGGGAKLTRRLESTARFRNKSST